MNQSDKEKRTIEKLKRELGSDILSALNDPTVIEIMLNPDCSLWVEKHGGHPEKVGKINPAKSKAIIGTVADALGTIATTESPIVEGELPIDGSRFEGVLPPIVSNPCFTIRKKATKIITLDEYVASGIISDEQVKLIRDAIAEKKNIIIAGSTGSGKTTLVNAVIDGICDASPNDRLVIIEDTNEIQCKAENTVIMRTSENVDQTRLLKVALRKRPDRIITGEVRGGEALALLKSWNTGHGGGVCTLHSNSAFDALERLEQMIGEVSERDMMRFISSSIDLVIFIKRDETGTRKITEIVQVDKMDHDSTRTYNTTSLLTTKKRETL